MSTERDSSDDFFNNFNASSPPAKTSQALKPPSASSGNAPKVTSTRGPPPPPPPARRTGPDTKAPSGASTRPRSGIRGTTGSTSQSTASFSKPMPPSNSSQQAPTSYYGTSTAPAASSVTARITSTNVVNTTARPPPRAANAPAAKPSNSYYGQHQPPSQTQTRGATSLLSRAAPTNPSSQPQQQQPQPQQSYHLGTNAYQQQPVEQLTQQPQPTNFYATAAPAASTPDTSGDWFTPDVDSSVNNPSVMSAPSSLPNSSLQQQQQQHQMFQSSSSLEGNMDGGSMAPAAPSVFMPGAATGAPISGGYSSSSDPDFENEPPLLEELGININHILLKVKAVVVPFKRFSGQHSALLDPAMIVEDADLAGPAAFGLLLGGELLLTGKIHFGYIYGFGLFGCLAMTLILNLMSPQQAVSVWTVTSILGYALIPVNLLAAVKIVLVDIVNLETLGQILALLTVLWSTTASVRLLEVGCGMRDQRYLLAYPIALLYSAFVLITIF